MFKMATEHFLSSQQAASNGSTAQQHNIDKPRDKLALKLLVALLAGRPISSADIAALHYNKVTKVTREDQCDYERETHCEREGQGQNKCENKCDIDGENDTKNEGKNEDHYGDDGQCNHEDEDQRNHEDEDQSISKNHKQVTLTYQPPTPTVRIPAAPFIAGVGLLPLGAFAICVLVTFIKDYHESTIAICPFDKIPSYLPTVCAATDRMSPQRYFWRVCMALQLVPRLFGNIVWRNNCLRAWLPAIRQRESLSRSSCIVFRLCAEAACFTAMSENICLAMVAFVGTTDNYNIHEQMFMAFVALAHIYMLLNIVLFRWSCNKPFVEQQFHQLKRRLQIFGVHFIASAAAVYFFYRHHRHCELGVYTLFSLSEYVVVVSNVAFHVYVKIADLGDNDILVTWPAVIDRRHKLHTD